MIKDLRDKFNTAMIMISHDLGVVAEVSDDVAGIYAGEVIEYASKEQLFDNPNHPYTNGLIGALPDLNKDVERLSPIHGLPPDPRNLPECCSFSPRCPYFTEECLQHGHIELTEVEPGHYTRCCKPDKAKREAKA